MLRILGSPKKLCSGWTRREMLWAGGLGLFGLGLSDVLRLSDLQAAGTEQRTAKSFGRAKSCILLYLYGSPSQIETFDMKPDAPPEIRGEFKPIRSRLPGCDVCELLPHTAQAGVDTELRLTVKAVFESLKDLDPRAAEAVWLRSVEGMTIDEVSRSQHRRFWDVRADYDFGLKWMADQLKG